jgi:hypothetical protein
MKKVLECEQKHQSGSHQKPESSTSMWEQCGDLESDHLQCSKIGFVDMQCMLLYDDYDSLVLSGMYDQQLAYWRSVYPAEDFCIVSYDMFSKEPTRTLQVVSDFIGLREFNWQSVIGTARNNSAASTVCDALLTRQIVT